MFHKIQDSSGSILAIEKNEFRSKSKEIFLVGYEKSAWNSINNSCIIGPDAFKKYPN
jgi:hypothetical protein